MILLQVKNNAVYVNGNSVFIILMFLMMLRGAISLYAACRIGFLFNSKGNACGLLYI